jgi:hypothetical protein
MKIKFPKHAIAMILPIVLLLGCSLPAGISFLSSTPPTVEPQVFVPPPPPAFLPQPPQPGQPPLPGNPPGQPDNRPPTPTPEPAIPTPTSIRAGLPSLFKLVKSVDVTPAGNLVGGMFVRIGYVPGKDRMTVAFQAKLGQKDRCPIGWGYGYRVYSPDMGATGSDGVLNCYAWADSGGLFAGNDLYVANLGHDNKTNTDGWYLAKYDAVTWKELVSPFFYPVSAPWEDAGDPMVELVNGQIDVSSLYKSDPKEQPAPWKGFATHHQLFTTDLKFVGKRVLSDTPHVGLAALTVANGVTNFLAGTGIRGNLVVMQYDKSWKYLGTKTVRKKGSAPEGMAFDGTRFYVAYLDDTSCPGYESCYQNVHLAAFDSNWSLLEDIAVTSYSPQDHKEPNRPTLTLRNSRIYVAWDQAENETFAPGKDPHTDDIQVHVKVYDLVNLGNGNPK